MLKRIGSVGLSIVLFTLVASGQTVTTSGGTTGAVPVFTGSATVGNSVITQSGSNVGIGTASPAGILGVGSANQFYIVIGTNTALELENPSGNVLLESSPSSSAYGVYYDNGEIGSSTYFRSSNASPGDKTPITILGNGNIGIGTTSPGAILEVDGNVKLTSGSGASITYPDSTVQSTAWNGTLTGGDYAESVDVTGNRAEYEPGDVLIIDPDHSGKFLKATEGYSTSVAGVYSTKPGLLGRRQKTDKASSTTEVPMAMVGIVPTKVSTENGPIKRGDLLVASSTPGRAMKGTDRSLLTGAVIGKAMGSLDSGTGVIEVLISLK